ncbi:PAS domain S-box (fragment) [Paraburkholderia ribeironis]|uniref:histidine kinase n=1 Tax=Paraburkholderia ribeironis TaxID=1247936 RepID=A0A1N7RSL2_9BURK
MAEDGQSTQERQYGSVLVRKDGQNRFRDLWEWLPLGVLALDEQGGILTANRRAERLFGYEASELAGKPVSLLVPDVVNDRMNDRMDNDPAAMGREAACAADCFSAGRAPSLVARRRNGSEFPVDISFSHASRVGDMPALVFIEDRADHYDLLKSRRDLVHLARVSTMGELAGSLAHELNQPLTAILSNVQAAQRFMAAESIDVAEVQEILNDIVQDDYRASEVIRRIRLVVRKGDMEFALLNPAAVIRDVVLLLHSDAIMRQTRVTVELCADPPQIYADKVQLQQVALNLLLNAFDAMHHLLPAERAVSIALTAQDDATVRIAVRDCGQGLTVEQLDTVFKPFYTSKPHGLGLGLSISRSIVELHGGRLWAENNLDRGATFYVTLPAGNGALNRKSR